MNFLLSATAFAQDAAAAAPKGPSMVEVLVMPLGFLVIMYFFIIRPQQKKAKEVSDLLSNLKVGDEVVTTGGLIGKVRSVADGFVSLDVAANTTVKVVKGNITGLAKATLSTEKPAKA
jgi:preprotein translocase subunit YajC